MDSQKNPTSEQSFQDLAVCLKVAKVIFGKDLSIAVSKYDVVIEWCNLFAAKYEFFLNNASAVTISKDVLEDAHQLAYQLLKIVLTWLNKILPDQITYDGTSLLFTQELEVNI